MNKIIDINNTLHKKILNNIDKDCLVKSIAPIYDMLTNKVKYEIILICNKTVYTSWSKNLNELNLELISLRTSKYIV